LPNDRLIAGMNGWGMYKELKFRVHEILGHTREFDLASKAFNYFIVALISLNVLAVIIGTVNSLHDQYSAIFWAFEIFSVAVFSIEYLARLWVCNIDEKYREPVKGRISYIFSPMAIIDLLSIVPFYLPFLIPLDLRFLRILRLFRLIRILKLVRYSESLNMLGRIVRSRKEDLLITLFIITIVLIISSTLMYYAEHEAQPDKFANIPDTMYWGIITIATIGYGDIYPVTAIGKFFSAIIALSGIAMFALPAGIIGSSFIEERQKAREKAARQKLVTDIEKVLATDIEKAFHDDDICPHCGKSRYAPVDPACEKIVGAPLIKNK
jgi:voltage-gated potassium channel